MPRADLTKKITITIIALCLALIVLGYAGLERYSSAFISRPLNAISGIIYRLTKDVGHLISRYAMVNDYARQMAELRSKNLELAKENAALKMAKQENELLKRELEISERLERKIVPANIIGEDIYYGQTKLIIDRGTVDGVKTGLGVINSQGIIIGKIDAVKSYSASVMLLIDNQSRLAVQIVAEEAIIGLARGESNLNVKITMLPKDKKIESGSAVVTSSLNELIPAGIMVGYTGEALANDAALWQEILVKLPVKYGETTRLAVISSEER